LGVNIDVRDIKKRDIAKFYELFPEMFAFKVADRILERVGFSDTARSVIFSGAKKYIDNKMKSGYNINKVFIGSLTHNVMRLLLLTKYQRRR